jgi:NAD(P)-dependent dehydrogenase (short-subunit alcohol dehydrogenase family)
MKNYQEMFGLKGERAIVTGAVTGLGNAIAKCFLSAGAEVIVVGLEEQASGEKACAELGAGAHYRQFDITATQETDNFVKGLVEEFGKITLLVNNAGVHCKKPIEETTDADFRKVIDVHVMGAFALTRAVVPYMKAQKKGSIIFQASMTAFIGQPYVIAYSCAKSGYLGMVRTLATEISADGIRVNGIAPGWIDTPMLHRAVDGDEVRKRKILGRTPMAKFGNPEDIGWAAVYLASEAAGFVNGVVIPVDGGALIGF